MSDVLCLGEILVDWVCTTVGAELPDAESFTKAPGGAPANTAVGLARQGVDTAFIGRVSKDEFGIWLKSVLRENGINVDCTIEDSQAQTRMAYVVTTSTGDRKLAEFSRISCADTRLTAEDLKPELFKNASVLHFGSISLIEEPARSATRRAVELARENGMLISYDPNVRLSLWPSPEACRKAILDSLSWADIVKINEPELEFLTGKTDLKEAEKLRSENGLSLFIITLDSRGAFFATPKTARTIPGFSIKLVEATGAGDGFNAGILAGLLSHIKDSKDRKATLNGLDLNTLENIVKRANAIGGLACTKAGAIPALPTSADIDEFLLGHKETVTF
ncbi:MAG: histidine kinase [Candidatus Melainabacteria bacterium]|nr:histidine kinase [Candidatus Melainabacteria bacterium]